MRITIKATKEFSHLHIANDATELFQDSPICIGYYREGNYWNANISTPMGLQFLRDGVAEKLAVEVLSKLWPVKHIEPQYAFDHIVFKTTVVASDADDGDAHVPA